MCDVHAAVLGRGLAGEAPPEAVPGHPVHTFRLENEKIRALVADYRGAVAAPGGVDREEWREAHAALAGIDAHYQRKEYLVFPFLERAGIAGPPKVMWGVRDEIREKLAAAGELVEHADGLEEEDLRLAVGTVVEPMLEQVESMTGKEDKILWPMAMQHRSYFRHLQHQ